MSEKKYRVMGLQDFQILPHEAQKEAIWSN